jgi:hydroxymethylbilane synthase
MPSELQIRLGTRASALARWQAEWVAERLRAPGIDVTLVPITTRGDRQQGPIGSLGGRGLFTKEIQRALLDGDADLAVHSLKDLPTEPVPGLSLAAVPERGPIGDVLVSRRFHSFATLAEGAAVGTGSMRRRAQLLHARPDLAIRDIRGNVDTRLRKLDEGQVDAIVLAEAGLRRLGFAEHIREVLPREIILPAVGQGALGLETRTEDTAVRDAVGRLDHPSSHAAVTAERTMLFTLQGGCLAPVGAWCRADDAGRLTLTGRVLSADGSEKVEATHSADPADAEPLGRQVAHDLLAQGAGELIRAAREPT